MKKNHTNQKLKEEKNNKKAKGKKQQKKRKYTQKNPHITRKRNT